jgi:hypothetical protein
MNLKNVGFNRYVSGRVHTAIHEDIRLSAKDSLFRSTDKNIIHTVSDCLRQFAVETHAFIPKVSHGIRETNYPEARWFNGVSLDGY